MPHHEHKKLRFSGALLKLLLAFSINTFIPFGFYFVLRALSMSEPAALVMACLIPAVRTSVLLFWRRRLDWIGLFSVLGFAAATGISLLTGGNSLLLKIQGPLLTGAIGLIFLFSVVLKKPVLMPLLLPSGRKTGQTAVPQDKGAGELDESRITRRVSFMTMVIGAALCIDSAVLVTLAASMSTDLYAGISPIVTIGVICVGAVLLWVTRWKQK